MIHYAAKISPKAHIDNSCVIGAGTTIRQFASVTGGTVLGEDCNVWPGVVLHGPRFGDRCKIASGVVMGPGFDIGNDVFIGPNVVFANDVWPETDMEGWDPEVFRKGALTILVGDGSSIGANAVICPGVRIGGHSVVAAGAVVTKSIGDECVYLRSGEIIWRGTGTRAKRMRLL